MVDHVRWPDASSARDGVLAAFLMLTAIAAVIVAAIALAGYARATEITPHDRAACILDVRKLCPDELARRDIPGGIACLIRNRDRLSVACRKALADHGA